MITYEIENKLYINLTNRCTNNCIFCIRRKSDIKGYNLWLEKEPSVDEIISEIGSAEKYEEIVFCGFGEPLIRLPEVLEVSKYIKKLNKKVRINTNGQANLICGKSVAQNFAGFVDAISISLNAANKESYQEICSSKYGIDAYDSVINFAAECTRYIPEVTLSVVDIISEKDIEQCALTAKKIGVNFRIRHFNE